MEDESEGRARVEISGLWVRFGAVAAVRGIDLTAFAGRATALLGRNGAGKSTTMRVLAGVIPPSEGTVRVDGLDVAEDLLAIKRVTGYCPDVGGLVPRATPWEHLQLAARLRRIEDWEDRALDLLERFDLGDAAHRVTSGFSHGMGRRLSVILASFHEPAVLLLDEPFDGVDPARRRGHPRGDRRRAGTGCRRTRLDPPAGPRDPGLRERAGAARWRQRGGAAGTRARR